MSPIDRHSRHPWLSGLALAGLIFGTGLFAAMGPGQTSHGFGDGIYHVSLDVIRKEIGEAKKFPVTSESPSPWLSDFFGLQRIWDVPTGRILKDLVPGKASVLAESPALKLRFAAGFTATFYIGCPISIDGAPVADFKPSFVEITDFAPAFKDRYEALLRFLEVLEKAGWAKDYLVPNPYAEFEKVAAADLSSEARPRPTGWPQYQPGEREKKLAAAIAGFEKAPRGILMFGDTHGSEEDYGAVWGFLNRQPSPPAIDWLGLEMLTRDQQSLVDDYLGRPADSPEFRAAEQKLVKYFSQGWDKRFANPGPPDEGHYFRLVKWARAHKVKVYALDAVGEYTLFRYGEFPLGATVRNIEWADAVPLAGRGVVYGGSAHFVPLPATPYTFQDYVKRRDPKIELFY